jgi:ATP-dependent DNA helicase RecG
VRTRLFSERARERVYELVAKELAKGRQAFVVYPLVEESEKVDLQSATEGARKIAEAFPDHPVGLLHGRMSVEEKDGVMRAFRDRRVHLLVSTTVVEVGVDVPNATVMVVGPPSASGSRSCTSSAGGWAAAGSARTASWSGRPGRTRPPTSAWA